MEFSISPEMGIPLETEFTLSVVKDKGYPLKCEFGYYNKLGKIVIPTIET